MSDNAITCELVDDRDLDTRYLAGGLSQEEAEGFEAHYFGCERCWGLVRQGMEVRSALGDSGLHAPAGEAGRRRATYRWWGMAAAAGIVLAGLGLWRFGSQTDPAMPEDVLRGDRAAFVVVPAPAPGAVAASWSRLPGADVYRVRLYSPDGLLILERETSDSFLSVGSHTVSGIPPGGEVFWQVLALDRLRNIVARSDLTRAVLPDP